MILLMATLALASPPSLGGDQRKARVALDTAARLASANPLPYELDCGFPPCNTVIRRLAREEIVSVSDDPTCGYDPGALLPQETCVELTFAPSRKNRWVSHHWKASIVGKAWLHGGQWRWDIRRIDLQRYAAVADAF